MLTPPDAARRGFSSWLRSLPLFFLTLLIVGCGDSREDYVYTGTVAPPSANVGSLTFNFVNAQTVYAAPENTLEVRFQLYSGAQGGGTLLATERRPYAASITLDNVSTDVESTVLTFYTGNGFPVGTLVAETPVVAGQNLVVDFRSAAPSTPELERLSVTPASLQLDRQEAAQLQVVADFDNGDNVTVTGRVINGLSYSSSSPGVASVNGSGVVTGVAQGNTTVTATLVFQGTTVSDSVAVAISGESFTGRFEVAPPSVTVVPGQVAAQRFQASFLAPNTATAANVSATYTVTSAPSGGSISSVNVTADGQVNADLYAAAGNYTVDVSYVASGRTFSEQVTVIVTDPQGPVARIELTPDTIDLPRGGYPYTFEVTGYDYQNNPVSGFSFNATSSDGEVVAVTGNSTTSFSVLTGNVTGEATITVSSTENSSIEAQTTVSVESVTEVAIEGDFDLNISQSAPFNATATLSGGSTIEGLEELVSFEISAGGEYVALNGTSVVALNPVDAGQVTLSTTNPYTGNVTVSHDITVDIREVQLVEANVDIGGLAAFEQGYGSIPAGLSAAVAVTGTFEDGSTRPLANTIDYTLSLSGSSNLTLRTPPNSFRTSGLVRTGAALPGEGSTLTVSFLEPRGGNIEPALVELNVVSINALSIEASFAHYGDDVRLLSNGSGAAYRELDVRASCDGVSNFRLVKDNVQIRNAPGITLGTSIGDWPMLGSNSVGFDGTVNLRTLGVARADASPQVIVATPVSLTLLPNESLLALPGQTVSFSAWVDYGDGPVNRTLDYPVYDSDLSSFYDEVYMISRLVGSEDDAISYFIRTDATNPRTVFLADQRTWTNPGTNLVPAIGVGSQNSIEIQTAP